MHFIRRPFRWPWLLTAAIAVVLDRSSSWWWQWQWRLCQCHKRQWRDGGGGTNCCCKVDNDHHHCRRYHWPKTSLLAMPLHHRPSIPRQPPLTKTSVNKDHHCHGCHQPPLPSKMTAFALPLPSPSVAFAISVATAIALAADAIAENKDKSKVVNDSYHRALRKPHLASVWFFGKGASLKWDIVSVATSSVTKITPGWRIFLQTPV